MVLRPSGAAGARTAISLGDPIGLTGGGPGHPGLPVTSVVHTRTVARKRPAPRTLRGSRRGPGSFMSVFPCHRFSGTAPRLGDSAGDATCLRREAGRPQQKANRGDRKGKSAAASQPEKTSCRRERKKKSGVVAREEFLFNGISGSGARLGGVRATWSEGKFEKRKSHPFLIGPGWVNVA